LVQPAPSHSVTVYGSRGALRYDFSTDDIFLSESGGEWIKQAIPSNLVREWNVEQDFIDAIREGKEVHPNFHDGVKYMEFTESIFQSVEIGKKIHLSS
jgi:predicted dehydrogenase